MAKQHGIIATVSAHPYLTIAGLIVAVIGVYYAYKMFKQGAAAPSLAAQQQVQPSQYTAPQQTTSPSSNVSPVSQPNFPQTAAGGLTAGYVGGNINYNYSAYQTSAYTYSVYAPQTTTTSQYTYSPQVTISTQRTLQYAPSYNAGTNVAILGAIAVPSIAGLFTPVGALWEAGGGGQPAPTTAQTIATGGIPLSYTSTTGGLNMQAPPPTPTVSPTAISLPTGIGGSLTPTATTTTTTKTPAVMGAIKMPTIMGAPTTHSSYHFQIPTMATPQFKVPFLKV